MTFNYLNRRIHLYTGLVLSPWIILYAISSIPFSHGQYFEAWDKAKGLPAGTVRAEIPYDVQVPDGDRLRDFGARVMSDTGLKGSFGVYRQGPEQVNVYVHTVWHSTQVKYMASQKKLVIEDRRFRWDQMLTGIHAKGGFQQESLIDRSWSAVIDLVCLALLAWIASGLYMWWKLPALRAWGWLAIVGCSGAFLVLLLRL